MKQALNTAISSGESAVRRSSLLLKPGNLIDSHAYYLTLTAHLWFSAGLIPMIIPAVTSIRFHLDGLNSLQRITRRARIL
jgi:hypothetical protein